MGGFRKYCVMHSNPSDPRAQKRPPVTAPFQMLEKATGKDGLLELHQKMQCHQLALEAGIAIIRSVQKPKETSLYRISTQNQEMFEKDMNALRAIISTIILCGKQNIPLRGHRDDSIGTASNKGNFHAILMLLGNSDKNLQEHLLTGRRNATSTSKTVQEEVIRITGEYILAKVTQPIQREEILSVCLRFLDLVWPRTTSRGQAYDGASAMSSEACGVQGRIRRIAPMALYTHCNSHVLNLSVAAACRLTSVRNMIGTLNETFLFFHFSPKRQRFLEQVLEKCGSTSRKEKLKGLCKTRWVERHECYETFYELYEYVCISLEVIVDRESHPHVYSSLSFTWDRETKTKAQGLLANLKTFGFISTFFITKNSLGTLKPIAAKLQKKDQDVFRAYSMIDDTIKAVARVKSNIEEEGHEWFEDASRLADKSQCQESLGGRNIGTMHLA